MLELQDDIEVVGEATSSSEFLEQLETVLPDVTLIDLKMPGIDGIEAARLAKAKYPHIKLILLTNYDDEEYVLEAIKAGADGYVLKDVKKGDLIRIIRGVLHDHAFIDPTVARKLFRSIRQSTATEEQPITRPAFSERELQILAHLAEGRANKDIAGALCLSTGYGQVPPEEHLPEAGGSQPVPGGPGGDPGQADPSFPLTAPGRADLAVFRRTLAQPRPLDGEGRPPWPTPKGTPFSPDQGIYFFSRGCYPPYNLKNIQSHCRLSV